MLKIKYSNSDKYIDISGYTEYGHIVTLYYETTEENLSGFMIYDDDGNIIKDCSDFTHRYDVLENESNEISYSNDENVVQTEKLVRGNAVESVNPMTNEELTECVADLMYEVSLAQLGMTGGE